MSAAPIASPDPAARRVDHAGSDASHPPPLPARDDCAGDVRDWRAARAAVVAHAAHQPMCPVYLAAVAYLTAADGEVE
ncbi:hypothetical protein ACWEKT_30100 [Nocardia takedensis]